MNNYDEEKKEISFNAKTNISIHRKLAQDEGLTLKELHEKFKKEECLRISAEIREAAGIELLTREELDLMIDELSLFEKEMNNMETSQLLTFIHQGYGKLPGLTAATLLKVKRDSSYEIIKKLRKLLEKTTNDESTNTASDTPDYPQLNNPELDKTIQNIQGILNNPTDTSL